MKHVYELGVSIAKDLGLDADLVSAMITVESSGNPWVTRYEPGWSYFYRIEKFSELLRITQISERVLQATSFGPLQVMGSVARELGFQGYLTELTIPEIAIKYGCLKFKQCLTRYPEIWDAVSAYNQGSPRKEGVKYLNQEHVDKVAKRYALLKSMN